MRTKALENLMAARTLLNAGSEYSNAIASRSYYAAYQGCCWRLEQDGCEAPVERGYWGHHSLPTTVVKQGILDPDEADVLQLLMQRRMVAYYYPEGIANAEAREGVEQAEALLQRLEELHR